MYPVLLSINGFSLTTITVFLYLAFFSALFIIWRLSRLYELDSEKTLDLFLMTSVIGLLFARLDFILTHLQQINNWSKALNFFKYPGYSFWGGFLAGLVFLWLVNRKVKSRFWLILDIAIVGVFLGISLTSFGCLLSVCQYGNISHLPFAVTQVGLIGKRFPLQIIESLFFLLGFFYLWKKAIRYHFVGVVGTQGLLLFGLIKFCLEFFRGDKIIIPFINISLGTIFSLLILIFGFTYFYKTSKRSLKLDLVFIKNILINSSKRQAFISKLNRGWYNFMINTRVAILRRRRKIVKSLNVKQNPTQF